MLRRRPNRTVVLESGPWRGMMDSLDAANARKDKARLLQNCYPLDAQLSAVVGRPGCQQAGAQGGASGKRTGQLVHQFNKRNGTSYTVRIVGGQGIQTFDWGSRAWTTAVSVANLTSASITLSETARCYAVTYTDKMVVSDGVNTPWMWDGTSGGGLTKLTNCPVLYGQPWVYYAKLFGIKASERITFVWSEENDATTGYESGGFTNAWEFAQTGSEALVAGCGTNEAMYVFRRTDIARVQGAVNTDFATAGVRSDVSENIGTLSPASVLVHEQGSVYFLDSLARPQCILPGGGLIDPPLWNDVRETIANADLNPTNLLMAQSWYDPETRTIGLGYSELAQGSCTASVQVSPATREPVAIFRGYPFDRIGIVQNASGREIVMHLDSDGFAYDHGTEDGSLWDDELNAGTQAISHAVTSMPMGFDTAVEKRWDRIDFSFRATNAMTCSVAYETPNGISDAQEFTVSPPTSYALWDVAQWDVDKWASGWLEIHHAVGWDGIGRWLAWTLSHAELGERFGLAMASVEATPQTRAPGVR